MALVERFFQRLAGFEFGHHGGRNCNGLAGARIAALRSGTMIGREGAEANEANLFALLERFDDSVEHRIYSLCGVPF